MPDEPQQPYEMRATRLAGQGGRAIKATLDRDNPNHQPFLFIEEYNYNTQGPGLICGVCIVGTEPLRRLRDLIHEALSPPYTPAAPRPVPEKQEGTLRCL